MNYLEEKKAFAAKRRKQRKQIYELTSDKSCSISSPIVSNRRSLDELFSSGDVSELLIKTTPCLKNVLMHLLYDRTAYLSLKPLW